MADIRVPKLNNNDATYTLVEWLIADGNPVGPGEAVVVLETSKAIEELVSEEAGALQRAAVN
jgi:2-oxoglutarate dehydrogenase E2 component (dihydrolipoamide succinyltransferase)